MSAVAYASDLPRLAKYELMEEIGHGGMATVYRARDPRLGREVAVKLIHKHLRENAEVATRFVAEARAAAKLRHPGIVEVYDVSSEDDPERYLVVELLRGATLRRVLQDHREMPAEIGAAITLQLCEAVEHAHGASIIHRDIKPENVLVELPGDRAAASVPVGDKGVVIKLTDFGIAKILDAQGVTSTGQVLGSPAHMAPEQIEGGEVDPRTDVFALGVLLYECLVGHLPFEGKNPAQVLRRVLEGEYAPVDRERPGVGGRWGRVAAEALAGDVAQRTPSPAALGEQLRAELDALGMVDPRAEIEAYFADPAAYEGALAARLVPRLVARGEAARDAGDVPGAACDFNRALALAPQDLSILKRVGTLHASAGRWDVVRRVAAILAGSAALGVAAFGVARAVKARAHPESTGATTAASSPSGDAPSALGASAASSDRSSAGPFASAPASSPRSSAQRPLLVPAPAPPPSSPPPSSPPAGDRAVRFVVNPQGAKLMVDGRPPVSWFSGPILLSPGPHTVSAFVDNSRCCKALNASPIVVQPAPLDRPDQPQTIALSLEIQPSTVTLAGAPSSGQVVCAAINFSAFAGSTTQVKLPEAIWSGRCQFRAAADKPPRVAAVTLRAGEPNTLSWPGD